MKATATTYNDCALIALKDIAVYKAMSVHHRAMSWGYFQYAITFRSSLAKQKSNAKTSGNVDHMIHINSNPKQQKKYVGNLHCVARF